MEDKIKECINCDCELQENETYLCFDCDFTNKITFEMTLEVHNLDTENFINNIQFLGERIKECKSIRLSYLNKNGFNEINLDNLKSIRIKEVSKI